MVLVLTGLTMLANIAIGGIASLLPKPKNAADGKSAEIFIKEVTGIDTSSKAATWQSIKGMFQGYTQWQTWVKLLMPPLPYPGAQGSAAVGSPNVTVNGGPLAFVGPLVATSCSEIPIVPNANTLGSSNVLVGVSITDLVLGVVAQAARAALQHGIGKGIAAAKGEDEPAGGPPPEEEDPKAPQQNDDCGRPGEPIDPVTGASESEFVDYQQPGIFRWERCDSSAWCAEDGPLGYGVRHSYQQLLQLTETQAIYIDPRQRRTVLRRNGNGRYRGVLGYALTDEGSGRFALRHGDEGTLDFLRDPADPGFARLVGWVRGTGRDDISYDTEGRIAVIRQNWIEDGNPLSAEYLFHYDRTGHLVELIRRTGDGECCIAGYAYDDTGCLVEVRDALGATRRFAHDAEHRIVRRSDANGYCFHYRFDELGRCTASAGDDGLWRVELRYAPGRTLVTQADNGLWVYSFDEVGTITEVLDPYGGRKQRITGPDGRVLREVDSGDRAMELLYDTAGRHIGRRDRWGNLWPIKAKAPALPNPLAFRMPVTALSREWGEDTSTRATLHIPHAMASLLPPPPERAQPRLRRDALGRIVERTDPLGHTERFAYGETGRLTCTWDADGQPYRNELASWNLCVARVDPRGGTTRYRYTRREKIAAVVDANGNESKYVYDCKDRVIQVTRHGVLRETYRYDVGDRLIAKDDGEGRPLLRLEIGPNGVQSRRELASGDVHSYAYDGFGNIVEASTGKAHVEIPHEAGRRVADQRDGRGVVHQWVDGRLTATTYFGRFPIAYDTLAPGDVLIRPPVGRPHRIQRAADGSVLRSLGSQTHELSRFDASGRCVGRLVWRSGDAEPVWSVTYEYSGTGELLATRHSRLGTIVNRYDAAHALVEQVRGATASRFAYDAAGNVVSTPSRPELEVAEGNRLAASGAERFIYNARNHLAEILHPDGRRTVFEYDSADMLVRITGGERFGKWTAEYDAIGRRTAKTVDGVRTEYFWDGDRLAAEEAADGALRLYLYANSTALLPFGFIDYASAAAEPFAGKAYFVFHDQVGMPELIEDQRGAVAWSAREVDPYGTITVAGGRAITYNLRFPGHYLDPETGLFYNRFRYYSPSLARYLQSDPVGQSGGLNLYAYPANPLVDVDVLGLHPDINDEPPASKQKPPVPQEEEPPPAPARAPEEEEPPPAPARASEEEEPPPAPARAPEEEEPPPAPARAPEEEEPPPAPARAPEEEEPPPAPARAPEEEEPPPAPARAPEEEEPPPAPAPAPGEEEPPPAPAPAPGEEEPPPAPAPAPGEEEPPPAPAPAPGEEEPPPAPAPREPTPREQAQARGRELLKQLKREEGVGTGSGRSGGHGTPHKRAGAELIREANRLPKNDPMREALKVEGERLIQQGKGHSHR